MLPYPGISLHQAHTLNLFSEKTFLLPTTTSAAKGLVLVYEIQLTGEISMSQKAKGHSDDKKSFTKLKESSKSFHIFSNFRKLC